MEIHISLYVGMVSSATWTLENIFNQYWNSSEGIWIPWRCWRKWPEFYGGDHLNMIFNELIENVKQMKLKNQKQSNIRNLFRS